MMPIDLANICAEKIELDGQDIVYLAALPGHFVWTGEEFDQAWEARPTVAHEVRTPVGLTKTPRKQQAFGANYSFSGTTNVAKPVTTLQLALLLWAQQTICPELNGLLLNWYDGPDEYIGPHHDKTNGLREGSCIVTISFGETRVLRFSGGQGTDKRSLNISLPHGSVLIIPWETNKHWKHSVPKSRKYGGRRVSVTIRAFKAGVLPPSEYLTEEARAWLQSSRRDVETAKTTNVQNVQLATAVQPEASRQSTLAVPPAAERIATYEDLREWVRAFVKGRFDLVCVVGRPGIAKTETIAEEAGSSCHRLSGTMSAFVLYTEAYEHRNELLWCDDVDDLSGDPRKITVFKEVCETRPVKVVSWHTASKVLDDRGIPTSFRTSSKVLVSINKWNAHNIHVQAVMDRGHFLHFDPDSLEIHKQVATWFPDLEVYRFYDEWLHHTTGLTMRDYLKAKQKREAGFDWKRSLLRQWFSGPRLIVAQLLIDERLKSDVERIALFRKHTGQTAANYHYHKQQLFPPGWTPPGSELKRSHLLKVAGEAEE